VVEEIAGAVDGWAMASPRVYIRLPAGLLVTALLLLLPAWGQASAAGTIAQAVVHD
jgi:hypothetical protein